jgi:hypothetical protein
MGKQRQGDVPVSGRPQAHFILIQADFPLGRFDPRLDAPAAPCRPAHRIPRGGLRGIDHLVGQFGRCLQTAAPAWRPRWVEGDQRPVVQPWPLGTIPSAQALSGIGRERRDQRLDAQLLKALPNGLVGGNGHHRGLGPTFQPQPQLPVMTVYFVAGDPLGGHTRRQRPLQHHLGQLRLGLELDRGGNPSGLTTILVRQPLLRQIQLPIEPGRPLGLA